MMVQAPIRSAWDDDDHAIDKTKDDDDDRELPAAATMYASYMDETREFSFHESPTHLYDTEPINYAPYDMEEGAAASPTSGSGKKRRWWDRMVSFGARRAEEDEREQDMYMRTVLESFNSSLSSNRHSSLFSRDHAFANGSAASTPQALPERRNFVDENGGVYVARPETPEAVAVTTSSQQTFEDEGTEAEVVVETDEAELRMRVMRRIQRRKAQEEMRARMLEKSQRKAHARGKILFFLVCVVFILAVLVAVAIAMTQNQKPSSSSTARNTRVEEPEPTAKASNEDFTFSFNEESDMDKVLDIVSSVLMSMSLWASLVVVSTHMTFRSFRLYATPLVLELSWVQAGYSLTALFRDRLDVTDMANITGMFLCISECFFNFAQTAFSSAIVFNMYRSVVSYADVLVDTRNNKRRFGNYTTNVIIMSVLATIALVLFGYRGLNDRFNTKHGDKNQCLFPSCAQILYVGSPLSAVIFNMFFYLRFKRTIGESYPTSVSGRLNKVAQSYIGLFSICWGSIMVETIIRTYFRTSFTRTCKLALECFFNVLGFGTAIITLSNFFQLRKAFDFGLSLKAIDPQSIEITDPLCILGEGTFAIVIKGKWHQRAPDGGPARAVDVAVKTFKRTQFESLEQMKEEAYLASKLVHPNVMMTFGCYTFGNMLYIVSEYLGGGTLQDVIDNTEELSYDVQLRYAHMIATGMRFLHGLNNPIIHRDLKPLNCIFDSQHELLKIADFGNSRLFQVENNFNSGGRGGLVPTADMTVEMTTNIGSACWAAPELLIDEERSEYSLKADVYSFGIICWQLYTCRIPYTDIPGSVTAVADAVVGGVRPPIPSSCPTLFSKIMRRCWHNDPTRRPTFEEIVPLLEVEINEYQTNGFKSNSSFYSTRSRSAKRLALSRREVSDSNSNSKEKDFDSSGTSSLTLG